MSDQHSRRPVVGGGEIENVWPAALTEEDAVRLAHSRDIARAADLLRAGLSVLITCDKVLVQDLLRAIVTGSGLTAVLPRASAEEPESRLAPLREVLNHRQQATEAIVVIKHLDLLADPALLAGGSGMVSPGMTAELTELLYASKEPTLLAFADPSSFLPEVLTGRFAAKITLRGVPREIWDPSNDMVRPLSEALLTAAENAHFEGVNSAAFYRCVSALNPIRLRQAVHYAMRKHTGQGNATALDLYHSIKEFKALSSPDVQHFPDVTFAGIGGYDYVKAQVVQLLALIDRQGGGQPGLAWLRNELMPRGLLLYGPPGTGKTLFAKAIASEWNASFIPCSGPELTGADATETVRNLGRVFAEARRNAPTVLSLDEFDAIACRRSYHDDDTVSGAADTVVNRIIAEIDHIDGNSPVLVIGTANRVDVIDPALLRPSRLRAIAVGLPDFEDRRQIAEICAREFDITVSSEVLQALASATEGFAGGELREVFRDVAIEERRRDQPSPARRLGEAVGRLRLRFQESSALSRSLRIESSALSRG
jgi:transitional endoplasmic reticulum ATPase